MSRYPLDMYIGNSPVYLFHFQSQDETQCSNEENQKPVSGVIGASFSGVSVMVANILKLFKVTVVFPRQQFALLCERCNCWLRFLRLDRQKHLVNNFPRKL